MMIGDLLEKKLKDLEGEEILVVMDDGLAFLGKLIDHDTSTLVLKSVQQAPSKKIRWEEFPDEKDKIIGYIDWTDINLEEVYVRTEHVLRIWRWEKKLKAESREQEKGGQIPIYTREETLPNERLSSMGDIQDTY